MPMNPRLLRPSSGSGAAPCAYPASLLLHFDGNFTDSSATGVVLTASNAAAVSATQSKFGGSSLSLGSTSYLSGAGGEGVVDFDGGAGTVEAWVYLTSHVPSGQYGGIVGPGQLLAGSGLSFGFGHSGGQSVMAATYLDAGAGNGGAVSLNEWHHVAYVIEDDGVTLRYYLDGVLTGTHTLTGSQNMAGVVVGNPLPESLTSFTGYIDDLRITKGLAVYDCAFTPPSAPLSACVTPVPTSREASLLLHFDGNFTDSSPNALTVTANGDAAISTSVKKFGSGSLALDGDGDYLTVADSAALDIGSSDFVIEFWIHPANVVSGNIQIIYDGRSGGGQDAPTVYIDSDGTLQYYTAGNNVISAAGALADSVWQHVAVSRASGTTRMFVDGTQVGSSFADATEYVSNDVGIGAYIGAGGPSLHLQGYIDELRITKGLAVYKGPFTPPTAPLSAIATPQPVNASLVLNFDGNFTDESVNALTVSAVGSAAISTSVKKFGSGSVFVDGGYLSIPSASDLVFNESDFTIECWIYIPVLDTAATASHVLTSHRNADNDSSGVYCGVQKDGSIFSFFADGSGNWQVINHVPGQTVTEAQWHHLAVVRRGSKIDIYLDGVSGAPASVSGAIGASGSFNIGCGSDKANNATQWGVQDFIGYIDGFRVTKAALYCDDFTPPTAPPTPTAVPPCCVASAPPPPSCDPYGTYLYDDCDGCDYGSWYADGNCGQYFDAWSPGACC